MMPTRVLREIRLRRRRKFSAACACSAAPQHWPGSRAQRGEGRADARVCVTSIVVGRIVMRHFISKIRQTSSGVRPALAWSLPTRSERSRSDEAFSRLTSRRTTRQVATSRCASRTIQLEALEVMSRCEIEHKLAIRATCASLGRHDISQHGE